MIGTTQIVDASGTLLSCIQDKDKDDYIVEELLLGKGGVKTIPEGYWITDLREEYLTAWKVENALGSEIYRKKRKRLIGD